MFSRREFLQVAAATAAIVPHGWTRAFAQQRLTQDELLRFKPLGDVTLLHFADLHGQLLPTYFREPSQNIGVGPGKGMPPHLTGKAFPMPEIVVRKMLHQHAVGTAGPLPAPAPGVALPPAAPPPLPAKR